MVFSSLIFLFFFLPFTLVCYYLIPRKYLSIRNVILLLCSLGFYFYGEPKLIVVMLLSIVMNYVFGLSMRKRHRKTYLTACITCNLLLLGLFKYANFFISILNHIPGCQIAPLNVTMPIGISFFTFQALSYVIDVYRQEAEPQKNPLSLGLYISMFPQLIAGPIVRYKDINSQIHARTHSFDKFSEGIDRFIFGLSKKILLSNVFAGTADVIFSLHPQNLSFATVWLGAVAYTLQIYFDFSGYSDMAIGLGKMLGMRFMENFDYPYISRSVTEFWRRWHISLSTWFRDYVYIPLGGNRCSPSRHVLNILIVWMLTGFWHGANYTFIAWGLYFGVLLIIEKKWLLPRLERLPPALPHLYALLWIILGWVFFRSDSLSYAIQYIKAMFLPSTLTDRLFWEHIHRFGLYFLLGILFSAPIFQRLRQCKWYAVVNPLLLSGLFLLCVMSLVTNSYNPFIYFRF